MLIMFTHLSHSNLNICDYQPLLRLSENSEKHYLAFLNIKISLVYSLLNELLFSAANFMPAN